MMFLLNNTIERIWVEVGDHVNYPIKNILHSLVARDNIDMANEITKGHYSSVKLWPFKVWFFLKSSNHSGSELTFHLFIF